MGSQKFASLIMEFRLNCFHFLIFPQTRPQIGEQNLRTIKCGQLDQIYIFNFINVFNFMKFIILT